LISYLSGIPLELAPHQFDRLPDFIGPNPSVALDKFVRLDNY